MHVSVWKEKKKQRVMGLGRFAILLQPFCIIIIAKWGLIRYLQSKQSTRLEWVVWVLAISPLKNGISPSVAFWDGLSYPEEFATFLLLKRIARECRNKWMSRRQEDGFTRPADNSSISAICGFVLPRYFQNSFENPRNITSEIMLHTNFVLLGHPSSTCVHV